MCLWDAAEIQNAAGPLYARQKTRAVGHQMKLVAQRSVFLKMSGRVLVRLR